LKPFLVPAVADQEPERRAAAINDVLQAAPSYYESLASQDLTQAWFLFNNIMDKYLQLMTDDIVRSGERKTKGFSFSLKSLLPPTTTIRGVVSAAETHLLHVHKTTRLLHDLKCRIKRGVHVPQNDTQWKKCVTRINYSAMPASVVLLAAGHKECPPFWVLDTIHGSLQLFVRAVDRANASQRLMEAKARLQGPHAFWKSFRPPRPRTPRAIRRADGQVISAPEDIMEEISRYWNAIYNDVQVFDQDKYWHRYRNQLRQLHNDPMDIAPISAAELMSFVRRMGNTSAGLDGRSAVELQALPLAVWELVADFWDNVRRYPNKALPTQLVEAGVHLIPKPGAEADLSQVCN
jgi:hypothetical protein